MGIFFEVKFLYSGVGRQPWTWWIKSSIALAHFINVASLQAVCCIERLTGNPAASSPMGMQMIG